MCDRFTDRAKKVMQLANQEAQRFNHEYICTEHILLGLIKEGSGTAACVLKKFDVDLRKIRLEIERLIQSGPDMITIGKLPQTPRAKKVIEFSMEEARNLNHNYVGTEHILLGLIRENEGVAGAVLMNFGLKLEDVREKVRALDNTVDERERVDVPAGIEAEDSPDLMAGIVTKAVLLKVLDERGYGKAELELVMRTLLASGYWRVRFLDDIVTPIVETCRILSPGE